MNAAEADLVRCELESLTRRAEAAESSLRAIARERDQLRAILTRIRTSLNENANDPGSDGVPDREEP